MEKNAYYRFAGRDLGLRFMLNQSAGELQKTAASGQEVNEEFAQEVNEFAGSLTYVDELTKRAHNYGMLSGFQQVIDAIESGMESEKIASFLQDAISTKLASAMLPTPETDEEATSFQDEMVKGAAEAIASFAGLDPSSDEVLDAAIDLVTSDMESEG
jgi:hypothetical protein